MRRRESGYALLVVLLLGALVLLSLSVAVPRLLTQGQREKEEELIFRGEQYKRAIGLFFKKIGRYPNSIEELLETNDLAFLRRAWPDPMTEEGEWHFIRVGPNGELIGSVREVLPGEGAGEQTDDEDQEDQPATEDFSGDVQALPIAGVASRSRERSIKIYDGYDHYYQWEFIYDPIEEAAGGQPVATGSPQSADDEPSESSDTSEAQPSQPNPR